MFHLIPILNQSAIFVGVVVGFLNVCRYPELFKLDPGLRRGDDYSGYVHNVVTIDGLLISSNCDVAGSESSPLVERNTRCDFKTRSIGFVTGV